MKQLPPRFRLRHLLSASALCFVLAPTAFAASLPSTPNSSALIATILQQDDTPNVSLCQLGDEPRGALLTKLTTALTLSSRDIGEPGFVPLDDFVEPVLAAEAAPAAEIAAVAPAAVAPKAKASASGPTPVANGKPGKLEYLSHLPSDLAAQAKVLAKHISEKFNVAPANANKIVSAAMTTSNQTGLPPTLLLAVMAVESSFDHLARNGNARGLMQIIPFWHKDKVRAVGGQQELMKVEKNIAAGSAILKEYVDRNGGVQEGLVKYNASKKAKEYSAKVLKQKSRFEALLPET